MTLEDTTQKPIFSGSLWTRILRNRIVCKLWEINEDGQDKFIAQKNVRYGKPFFTWKENKYWIDYKLVRHGKKNFEYDCDVNNSIGGLSFHTNNQKVVTPNQAGRMLKQGLVDFFIERGGIPAWYLLACVIAIAIVGGVLGYILMDAYPYKEEYIKLEPRYNSLVQENANLKLELSTKGES